MSAAGGVRAASLCVPLAVSGCVIHHVRTYVPDSASAPPTEDAAFSSTNCFEASTDAEILTCGSATLTGLNRTLVQEMQAQLGGADFAGRDVLLAVQRAWLLGLRAACHLPTADRARGEACLADQFVRQTAVLAAWHAPGRPVTAVAQYVHFRNAPGFRAPDPVICEDLAHGANASLARVGTADPAFIPGASEIAGSHGAEAGSLNGQRIRVELRVANVYGGFARRARGIMIGGAAVLDSVSLGNLLQQASDNQGGRFSSYASQTGDYAAVDVFSLQGRTLALLQDAWGFDAPAAQGDFAHAGVWNIAARPALAQCLFETFQMPAEHDVDGLPSFAAWRDALRQVRESASPAGLGVAFLRDQGQIRAEIDWTLLHMPLVATEQARVDGWTGWLRIRHDAVLDALFAWAQSNASHKKLFDQVFALMRPAAQDLVRYYQQTQALSGAEAKDAAGLVIMEMLYGATVSVAPTVGADMQAPGSVVGQKPRYPVLASPQ